MNARDEVLWQLSQANLPGWAVASAAAYRPSLENADPRDIDLAHALFRCVVKNVGLLRHLTEHYAGRPITRVDPSVQMVLAIGLAQLRFFDRLPPYAVVDQAVIQTKRMKLGKAGGFVNAVLRRALREPKPALPTPASPRDHARIVLSHPPEIFDRLAALMGDEKAIDLAAAHNREPPLILRGMPPVVEGVTATPHAEPGFYVVSGANESLLREWSNAGLAQAQDPTSANVIQQFDLSDAKMVLDRCCGVGTKTLQLARGAPQAKILAMDIAGFRIETLQRSIERTAQHNVRAFQVGGVAQLDACVADVHKTAAGTSPVHKLLFDHILIDAPCSNSGVLMRRPEARYRQDASTLQSLGRLQRTILQDTIPRLAPGGQLIYSTCSIWPQENEEQVRWISETFGHLALTRMQTTLPSLSEDPAQHHDGGFFALFDAA